MQLSARSCPSLQFDVRREVALNIRNRGPLVLGWHVRHSNEQIQYPSPFSAEWEGRCARIPTLRRHG
jgi:hypothetical protein